MAVYCIASGGRTMPEPANSIPLGLEGVAKPPAVAPPAGDRGARGALLDLFAQALHRVDEEEARLDAVDVPLHHLWPKMGDQTVYEQRHKFVGQPSGVPTRGGQPAWRLEGVNVQRRILPVNDPPQSTSAVSRGRPSAVENFVARNFL